MTDDDGFKKMLVDAAAQLPSHIPQARPRDVTAPTTVDRGDGTLDEKGMEALRVFQKRDPNGVRRGIKTDSEYLDWLVDEYKREQARQESAEQEKHDRRMRSVSHVGMAIPVPRDMIGGYVGDIWLQIVAYMKVTFGATYFDRAKVESVDEMGFVKVTFKPAGSRSEYANDLFKDWAKQQKSFGQPWRID